jgi:hypothetical protein
MSLSDYFPEEIQNNYKERALKVGAVLKLFVSDTNPPKEKRFIVVGFTEDKLSLASLYINSEINTNINWSQEKQSLQLEFIPDNREYLDWTSFIDCSEFILRETNEIQKAIEKRPEAIIGEINDADLELIITTVRHSTTINGKYKKRYGIIDLYNTLKQ